jgi:phytoene dehydrogenase-like protein
VLADHGWSVLVFEAQPEPGGAVRSAEVTTPGFRSDLFSAFYPFAAASPVIESLELQRYGLRWRHAPAVLAHPVRDHPAAVLAHDPSATAAFLDCFAAGDGDAWLDLYERWLRLGPAVLRLLLGPFPPLRAGAAVLMRQRRADLRWLARLAVLPVRRLAAEQFAGAGGRLLLGGCALHADLLPEAAPSAVLGWLLASLGQQHGFPVPEGGASELTAALVRRFEAHGGRVLCGHRVCGVIVEGGRAVGVRLEGGDRVAARRAVIADVLAPRLLDLVDASHLPSRWLDGLRRFDPGSATVKVDWALCRPIPWADPDVAGAGTVHITDSLDELSTSAHQLALDQVPDRPFLVVGQMTTADATRSPPGTESAWAYTHVPQRARGDAAGQLELSANGAWTRDAAERFADRIESRIEEYAPGFRASIIARHVLYPGRFEELDENLVGGAVNGGTVQLHQQLVFRPVIGLGRSETPVRRLFLGSASAHPGGGVHGAPGANAARAALLHDRIRR